MIEESMLKMKPKPFLCPHCRVNVVVYNIGPIYVCPNCEKIIEGKKDE